MAWTIDEGNGRSVASRVVVPDGQSAFLVNEIANNGLIEVGVTTDASESTFLTPAAGGVKLMGFLVAWK